MNTLDKATEERIEKEAELKCPYLMGEHRLIYMAGYKLAGKTEALRHKECVDALEQELRTKYENVIAALEKLCALKAHKDKFGKDELYEKEQPLAWEAATNALSNLK